MATRVEAVDLIVVIVLMLATVAFGVGAAYGGYRLVRGTDSDAEQ